VDMRHPGLLDEAGGANGNAGGHDGLSARWVRTARECDDCSRLSVCIFYYKTRKKSISGILKP
jgi:hypothetical protein